MKIILQKLIIKTQKTSVVVNFKQFNYFWGPIGTGKSTIPRLIMYCLGRDLLETPALQKEFISAHLHLQVNDRNITIDRQKGENVLTVNIHLPDTIIESYRIPAKSSSGTTLTPSAEVVNMSDLFFYLGGLKPPKVLRSKIKDETTRIRLSLGDLLWYCYLEQTQMDNSFFHLGRTEEWTKRLKSKDVLNYVLGYFSQNVSDLEQTLIEMKNKKRGYVEATQALKTILAENHIADSEQMLLEKENLLSEIEQINKNIMDAKTKIYLKNNNVLDLLTQKRRYLLQFVSEVDNEQAMIRENIEDQTQIKNELLMTELRVTKTHQATRIFKTLHFQTCPKCGNPIHPQNVNNICALCKQTTNSHYNTTAIGPELHERANEIQRSIDESKNELSSLSMLAKTKRNELDEINKEIDELSESNDSLFVQATSHLFRKKGLLEGKIKMLDQLLPLPQKVDELEIKQHKLTDDLREIEKKLNKARNNAEKNQQPLTKLKSYFLNNLERANFPQISSHDYEVHLDTKKFYPYLKLKDGNELEMLEFFNAGSGGKKTLFKTCFALALHMLDHDFGYRLPSLLIIDSPMKNIFKAENKEIFVGLHSLLYDISRSNLNDTQFIIIGSHEPPKFISENMHTHIQKFTTDINSSYPPLIPYYIGQ